MTKIGWTLYLNPPAVFCLTNETGATANFNFQILEAKLLIKRVISLPSLQNKLERALASGQVANYPVNYVNCRKLIIPQGLRNFSYQSLFAGENLPKACLFGLAAQSESSNFEESPYQFKTHNLQDISITCNSQRFPTQSFNLAYNANPKSYMRAFQSLYPDLWNPEGTYIDIKKYLVGGYCLYFIPLNSDASTEDSFAAKQLGPCRIDLTFENENNPVLILYVWAFSDQNFLLDGSRNCYVNFKL